MNTREKILTTRRALDIAEELRARSVAFKLVSGYFDVLQPSIVRELNRHATGGASLFALVLNPERPLMSGVARAELAASLRVIDYVIHLESDPTDLIQRLQPDEWIREESAHLESTRRLIQRVRERNASALEGRPRN